MWDKITDIDPKFRDRLVSSNFLTPLDQVDYLGKCKGGIYGMRPDMARCNDPLFIARLRPTTDIPGLFLSGQVHYSIECQLAYHWTSKSLA